MVMTMNDPYYFDEFIPLNELHKYIQQDPYYGVTSAATPAIIGNIYEKNKDNDAYKKFSFEFSSRHEDTDTQLHLIYLWIILLGLPSYKNDNLVIFDVDNFLDNSPKDLKIKLTEFKTFLSRYSWPLVASLFPLESSNTQQAVANSEKEFEDAFHEITTILPKLEDELSELQNVPPENMEKWELKKIQIARIENKISNIKGTPSTTSEIDNFNNSAHIGLPTEFPPDAKKQTPAENSFTDKGDYWEICYDGQCKSIKNSLGIRYIKYLIQNEGKGIHVSELYYSENPLPEGATDTALSALGSQQLEAEGLSVSNLSSTGPLMDEQGKNEYKYRIKELYDQIEEADELGDTDKAEELKNEKDKIVNQLAADFGLGGKPRKINSLIEKIRKNVEKRISTDIKKLGKTFPQLSKHLVCIETGTECKYLPHPDILWKFK